MSSVLHVTMVIYAISCPENIPGQESGIIGNNTRKMPKIIVANLILANNLDRSKGVFQFR
jgi:hypothetical protein